MPYLTQAANGGIRPMESPFNDHDLANAYCSVDELNIGISNVSLFNTNLKYGYQHFLGEIASEGDITSGLNPGLSSGLISKEVFDVYSTLVFNIARKLASEDDTSNSISIKFTNTSKFTCNYMVMIEYERSVVINARTGFFEV